MCCFLFVFSDTVDGPEIPKATWDGAETLRNSKISTTNLNW